MLGQPWHPGETLINGIGQGFVTATPLQLAVMTARVANDGYAVKPHLARDKLENGRMVPRPAPTWPDIGVSRQNLQVIRRGMYAVSNEPGGTAYAQRIMNPAMALAGKSGTAQVRRITAREREVGLRKPQDLPWKDRDHALFVAFAPFDAPRYACAVCVEHGIGGGAAAGPIVRDVLLEVQKKDIERAQRRQSAGLAPNDGHDHDHADSGGNPGGNPGSNSGGSHG